MITYSDMPSLVQCTEVSGVNQGCVVRKAVVCRNEFIGRRVILTILC